MSGIEDRRETVIVALYTNASDVIAIHQQDGHAKTHTSIAFPWKNSGSEDEILCDYTNVDLDHTIEMKIVFDGILSLANLE